MGFQDQQWNHALSVTEREHHHLGTTFLCGGSSVGLGLMRPTAPTSKIAGSNTFASTAPRPSVPDFSPTLDNYYRLGINAWRWNEIHIGTGDSQIDGTLTSSNTKNRGTCTLDGATPAKCTAMSSLVRSASVRSRHQRGRCRAMCSVLSSTTLTITGPVAATNDVNYLCL